MQARSKAVFWGAVLAVTALNCTNEKLVGIDECFGEGVTCEAAVPLLSPIPGWPTMVFPISNVYSYDVVASRTVSPTWVFPPPCDQCGFAQVEPAPDSGVWALLLVLDSKVPTSLRRIDADGNLQAEHVVTNAVPGQISTTRRLFLDEQSRPVVLDWLPSGAVLRSALDAEDTLTSTTLSLFPPNVPQTFFRAVAPGADGGVRIGQFDSHRSYVAEFSGDGDLRWKQTDLGDARDFPFTDDPGPLSYVLMPLTDGATAVLVPKDVEAGPGTTVGRTQTIARLEPDGNVSWRLWLGSDPTLQTYLEPGPEGSLVAAGAGGLGAPNAEQDDSKTFLVDRDGQVTALWVGSRIGYHPAVPQAMCVDAEGDIYVAALTGERESPQPTVCRMRGRDPSAEVECVAVEEIPAPASGLSNLGGLEWLIVDMASPEPGAVVLGLRVGIVRIDF